MKIISSIFVSLLVVGSVYAATTGDLNVQVYNGSGYDSFDLTPPDSDKDSFLKWNFMDGHFKLERAAGYLHVSEINGLTAQLSNMQNDINDRAYASHQHPISDVTSLQTTLDSKVSNSVLASATSSINSTIASLQTQVNGISTSSPVITNGVTKVIQTLTTATGTLLSSTNVTNVMYSVNIVTTASIGGASAGEILLEISPTNSSTSTWTVVNRIKNSQTITLAIVLNSVQDITYTIMGNVPAGYYVRLRSATISGTPTYTYITGQETQF